MELYKKKIRDIGLLTIVLFTVVACDKDKVTLENEFVIAFNETKTIASEKMTIKFTGIEESRCPDGPIYCIWEGVADVTFEISNDSETVISTLGTLSCSSTSFLSGHGQCIEKEILGYLFTLTSVDPYPTYQVFVDDTDYVVKLNVTKI